MPLKSWVSTASWLNQLADDVEKTHPILAQTLRKKIDELGIKWKDAEINRGELLNSIKELEDAISFGYGISNAVSTILKL